MSSSMYYSVEEGLLTLGPEAVKIQSMLEKVFMNWALECGSSPMLFPSLMKVEDLVKFDYFKNFPHLGVVASKISADHCSSYTTSGDEVTHICSSHLSDGTYMLPSAACYNIYLHLQNSILNQTQYISTIARCYRNEEYYSGLKRLLSFNMREIVCIGTVEDVQSHLLSFKKKIADLAETLDLSLKTEIATDPFFDKKSPKALLQLISPVKEEFVYGDEVAIASVNFHRNFFGERCNIRMQDNSYAFTGCVAFGIERWLHAILDKYGDDLLTIESKFQELLCLQTI
ncbi:amino acid--[acyl-carrier-protein] ligase 1 [Paenibacillus chitinolyticus]|nr:amino acid--[acyl-carrier-protein] ligase 1 [Paenibacillus chitinolyticus]